MRKLSLLVVLGMFVGLAALWAYEGEHEEGKVPEVTAQEQAVSEETKEKAVYVCPMHSEIRMVEPGECPKCGMKLEMMPKAGEEGEENAIEENKEKAHEQAGHGMHGMSGHKH